MPDETSSPKQEIVSGDGSHNYQAGRDVHVHGVGDAPQSTIVRPTGAEIVQYDPKVRAVISLARGLSLRIKGLNSIGTAWMILVWISVLLLVAHAISIAWHALLDLP